MERLCVHGRFSDWLEYLTHRIIYRTRIHGEQICGLPLRRNDIDVMKTSRQFSVGVKVFCDWASTWSNSCARGSESAADMVARGRMLACLRGDGRTVWIWPRLHDFWPGFSKPSRQYSPAWWPFLRGAYFNLLWPSHILATYGEEWAFKPRNWTHTRQLWHSQPHTPNMNGSKHGKKYWDLPRIGNLTYRHFAYDPGFGLWISGLAFPWMHRILELKTTPEGPSDETAWLRPCDGVQTDRQKNKPGQKSFCRKLFAIHSDLDSPLDEEQPVPWLVLTMAGLPHDCTAFILSTNEIIYLARWSKFRSGACLALSRPDPASQSMGWYHGPPKWRPQESQSPCGNMPDIPSKCDNKARAFRCHTFLLLLVS